MDCREIGKPCFPEKGDEISTHLSQLDGSDHEVCELFFVLHGDAHAAVDLLSVLARRPVLYAHDPDEVKGARDHDDAGGALLPHHAPKVADRSLRWTLGNNVRLRLDQTLKR
jgi:hypothetical protein